MLLLKSAPKFVAPAVLKGSVIDDFSLDQYIGKKYVLLFFYPADFSGLCPTEILAFQERIKEFESLDVQVVGVSTDSKFVHQRWLSTPINEGGIEGVSYPLVSDKSMSISLSYDVLAGGFRHKYPQMGMMMGMGMGCCCGCGCGCKDGKCDDDSCKDGKDKDGKDCKDKHCQMEGNPHEVVFDGIPMSFRATFLIDKHGKVRHESRNEFAMGRDVEEILRLVEGIKLIDETGGACPANWKRNKK